VYTIEVAIRYLKQPIRDSRDLNFFNVSTTIWWLHTYQDVDIFGIESIVQRERQVTPLVGIGGVIEVFLLSLSGEASVQEASQLAEEYLEIVVDYVRPRVVPKLP